MLCCGRPCHAAHAVHAHRLAPLRHQLLGELVDQRSEEVQCGLPACSIVTWGRDGQVGTGGKQAGRWVASTRNWFYSWMVTIGWKGQLFPLLCQVATAPNVAVTAGGGGPACLLLLAFQCKLASASARDVHARMHRPQLSALLTRLMLIRQVAQQELKVLAQPLVTCVCGCPQPTIVQQPQVPQCNSSRTLHMRVQQVRTRARQPTKQHSWRAFDWAAGGVASTEGQGSHVRLRKSCVAKSTLFLRPGASGTDSLWLVC